MNTDYNSLSNFELLIRLKDLDDSEEEIRFNKWELDFVDYMVKTLGDIEQSGGDNAILSSKQRKCIIDILEKYE